MTNQVITRRIHTSTLTFLEKPSEETRKGLIAAGYQFDGRSKQWVRREEQPGLTTEESVAQQLAA